MSLGPKQDPGLLAATHRMRVRRHDSTQKGIQPSSRDAHLPPSQGFLDRGAKMIDMAPGQRRNVDLGCPLEMHKITFDLRPR